MGILDIKTEMPRKVTREMVAETAGVSVATVTYVMRNTKGISLKSETRERVLSVAESLGYEPNFFATSLASRSSEIIGLLLPSFEQQFSEFYSGMIRGLVSEARETPYHFLYLEQDCPAKYKKCLAGDYLDGLVILQSHDDETHIRAVAKKGKPVVIMNFLDTLGLPHVSMDYEEAIAHAYRFMLSRKRKKIGLISCANCQPDERMLSKHLELTRANHSIAQFIHFENNLDPQIAKKQMEALVCDPTIDGFVIDSFHSAMRYVEALEKQGRFIGKTIDVAAIATDIPRENPYSEMFILQAQPEEVGRVAWQKMEKLLKGKDIEEKSTQIPFVKYEVKM